MRVKFLCVVLVCCTVTLLKAGGADSFNYKRPKLLSELEKKTLWATQYYVHQFKSCGNISLLDESARGTGLYADSCNFCKSVMEGTAFVTDSFGKLFCINFAKGATDTSWMNCGVCSGKSMINSRVFWTVASGYGLGVRNYHLQPYRTIAVDPAIILVGTVLFIPSLRGRSMVLPNGDRVTHDGYLFAGDKGSAIQGNHIDVFTGLNTDNPFPSVIKSESSGTFEAYIVTDHTIIASLRELHSQ